MNFILIPHFLIMIKLAVDDLDGEKEGKEVEKN
jgi:hypothetical protein